MASARVTVVGDTLVDYESAASLDTSDWRSRRTFHLDSQRMALGGVWRTAAALEWLGHSVTVVTAWPDDLPPEVATSALQLEASRLVSIGRTQRSVGRIWLDWGDGQAQVNLDDRYETALPDHWSRELPVDDSAAIVVQDYGHGVAEVLRPALERDNRPTVWDTHSAGVPPVSAAFVTCDRQYLQLGLGRETTSTYADVAARARALRGQLAAQAAIVTLGLDGAMGSFSNVGEAYCPTYAINSGKILGAGDIFAAALADAVLARTTDYRAAMRLAVKQCRSLLSTSARQTVLPDDRVIVQPVDLVATGGCFDLLHAGHFALLYACRLLGRRVIVLLNSDESVRDLKGPARPFVPEAARAAALLETGLVDDVRIFNGASPRDMVAKIAPDIFVKGGHYTADQVASVDAPSVLAAGGLILTVPLLPLVSTTATASAVLQRSSRIDP